MILSFYCVFTFFLTSNTWHHAHTHTHRYMHIYKSFPALPPFRFKTLVQRVPIINFFKLLNIFVSSCHNIIFHMNRRIVAGKQSQHWLVQYLVQAFTSRITQGPPGRGRQKVVYLTSLILTFKLSSAVTIRSGSFQFIPEIKAGKGYFPS